MFGVFFFLPETFEEVGLAGWNPAECIGRTIPGNGAFIAMDADIMPDLQLERPVAEGAATLYTFAAPYAQGLIDGIFKKRILDEFPFDGIGRTKLVLGARGQRFCFRLEIPATQITVSAHGIHMHALHGRRS